MTKTKKKQKGRLYSKRRGPGLTIHEVIKLIDEAQEEVFPGSSPEKGMLNFYAKGRDGLAQELKRKLLKIGDQIDKEING